DVVLPKQESLMVRVRADWENIGTAVIGLALAAVFVIGLVKTISRGRPKIPEQQLADAMARAQTDDPARRERLSSFSSLAKSSAIMTAGTLTSRVLGLVKASLLATAIGVTAVQADAFDIANKVPNTLYMLLAGGVVNAVLVPQIVRASKREDGGEDFTNRLLTLSFMILAAVSVLATLAAPLLVWLYSSGWSPEQMALATAFAYWCLPQLF